MNSDLQHSDITEKTNQKGQAFIEFLLLFAVLTLISFTVLRIVGGQVEKRWYNMANKITGPTPNPSDGPDPVGFVDLR